MRVNPCSEINPKNRPIFDHKFMDGHFFFHEKYLQFFFHQNMNWKSMLNLKTAKVSSRRVSCSLFHLLQINIDESMNTLCHLENILKLISKLKRISIFRNEHKIELHTFLSGMCQWKRMFRRRKKGMYAIKVQRKYEIDVSNENRAWIHQ